MDNQLNQIKDPRKREAAKRSHKANSIREQIDEIRVRYLGRVNTYEARYRRNETDRERLEYDLRYAEQAFIKEILSILSNAEREARIDEIYRWFDKKWADEGSKNMSISHPMNQVKKRLQQLKKEQQ
jgi:hypothetical protein